MCYEETFIFFLNWQEVRNNIVPSHNQIFGSPETDEVYTSKWMGMPLLSYLNEEPTLPFLTFKCIRGRAHIK